MVFRPATPGFLTTLVATILLLVVSFSVPWFKSVFFLRASLASSGVNGSITFGTLGYCVEIASNVTCSKPSVGYELDLNNLLGNKLPIQIPQVAVKWVTYALVLHIVALVLAAISAVFGLLAHIREMSMTCFSSCVSGMAAVVCLLAFIFDLILFFLARARINAVKGGSAAIGNGIWLTLAAWVLLFISGCMFGIGRCCIRSRPRAPRGAGSGGGSWSGWGGNSGSLGKSRGEEYGEAMRLDAVKAEADRKARQAAGTHEVGLPAFPQMETAPLRPKSPQYYEEEVSSEYEDHPQGSHAPAAAYKPARSNTGLAAPQPKRQASGHTVASRRQPTQEPQYAGGYVQGAPGSRAVDTTYSTSNVQPSAPAPVPTPASNSGSSAYTAHGYPAPTVAAAYPAPSAYGQTSSSHPTSPQSPQPQYTGGAQYLDPYAYQGQPATHHAQGSSYHSAYSHQQDASGYSQYPEHDGYNAQPGAYGAPPELGHQQPYQNTYSTYPPTNDYDYHTQAVAPTHSTTPQPQQPYPNPYDSGYTQQPLYNPYPAAIDTTTAPVPSAQSPTRAGGPRGPRSPTSPTSPTRRPWEPSQSTTSTDPPPNYSFDGTSSGYAQGYPQGKR